MAQGRSVTVADKADVTKLATQVKKKMKKGEKTPPEIAKAIKALPDGKKFELGSLRNRINEWKLHEDTTPARYKFDGRSGSAIAALPVGQLTYDITDPTTGKVIGVGSMWRTYHDQHSHPKGLSMTSNNFMIDPNSKTQDTLEKCRELAYRDALVLLKVRTKNRNTQHEGLIGAIDDAERRKAVEDGAAALLKQTEYTRHYTGLFANSAEGVSCIVTPAEGEPYVYITTENKYYGKKFYDVSDEGIKKAAAFALKHSTELQSRARSAARGEAIDAGDLTEQGASGVSFAPPPFCDDIFGFLKSGAAAPPAQHESIDDGGGMDISRDDATSVATERPRPAREMRAPPSHVGIDIDDPMGDDEQEPPASHEAVDFDDEGVAPAPVPARMMAPPEPLPRAEPEGRGAAARLRLPHAAKRPRAAEVAPAPGLGHGVDDLVPRTLYDAAVAKTSTLEQKLAEMAERLSVYESVDEDGADPYAFGSLDKDMGNWRRVRDVLIRLPNCYEDKPTGDSLRCIQDEGASHEAYLSALLRRPVTISFDRCPCDPREKPGQARATRLALSCCYWTARDRLPSAPVTPELYVRFRDLVNDEARTSGLLRRLVELRIDEKLPDCRESDVYLERWCLDFLVIGAQATAAGLVLRPRNFFHMWKDMGPLEEIVRYYGANAFGEASASIGEPVSRRRREERGG